MKNKFNKVNIAAAMFFTTVTLSAQDGRMGINTPDPKTTLDVSGKTDASGNLLITDKTGLQAPRLTRAELTAKGGGLYGADQKGALVYITDISGGNATGQRINITNTGYYFFDGSFWQKSGSGAYTAINGLTANSNSIKLGGALVEPTTISGLTATNKLSITGTGVDAVNIASSTLSVDADNRKIGIGINNPWGKLDVVSSSNNSEHPMARLVRMGTGVDPSASGIFFTMGMHLADYNNISLEGDSGMFFSNNNDLFNATDKGFVIAPWKKTPASGIRSQ